MSSLLKCGTTLTIVALAIREFFLVGKRVEGTCGGYDSVISRCTIITAAERKQCRCSSEEEHSLDKRKADISKLSNGTIYISLVLTAALRSPKPQVGVRIPGGMPIKETICTTNQLI